MSNRARRVITNVVEVKVNSGVNFSRETAEATQTSRSPP